MRILANENFPKSLVTGLRNAGHDVRWIREDAPGIPDTQVLSQARTEKRVPATFDKDFGELAFGKGLPAECGIILLRITGRDPEQVAARGVAAMGSREDWAGHFTVVTDDRIRMRPLPPTP